MTEPSKSHASSQTFAELYEKIVRQIKEGELVRGRVLSVDEVARHELGPRGT